MKNTIPWKSAIDINTTRNLFSLNNENLPYEIELHICSCGVQKRIIKKAKQELEKYQCSECGNEVFYDAAYYLTHYEWYKTVEKDSFYDLLQENLRIDIKYDADKNDLFFLLNLQIPNAINYYSQDVEYCNKAIFTMSVDKCSDCSEELIVEFDLDCILEDQYFNDKYPSQNEIMKRHPLLAFYKKQMLDFLIKHPLCDDLESVKYDCKSINDILFFLPYPHLKEYAFLTWQEPFLLPNDKPLTIRKALEYVLNYRKEKSLKKAVFQNYAWQISTTQKYYFPYVYCVCKYISDVNIATRMAAFTFNGLNMELRHDSGEEKLFTYLVQNNYTQKQIERLMRDFSKDYADTYFIILHMLSQFEDDMIQEIEKVKPKCYELHYAVVRYHGLAVAKKIFHINFKYSDWQQRGCVKKEPYSVQLPQNGRELYEWSQTLQNCLSGYAELIKNKHTTVYGFFKDGVLQIAVEIKNNEIVEAGSKYNQQPSSEDTELINAWFDEYVVQKRDMETSLL